VVVRVLEKLGPVGTLIAAMGCAVCFPALGAMAASVGLGFLAQFEGVFINKVLPAFALLALVANIWGWLRHHNHFRGVLSIVGPVAVLATLYPLWTYGWSTYLFYAGLGLVFVVSIVDVARPPRQMFFVVEKAL
jgi:mercuric ion transport protein